MHNVLATRYKKTFSNHTMIKKFMFTIYKPGVTQLNCNRSIGIVMSIM